MSAVSSRVCEGMWSQRVGGGRIRATMLDIMVGLVAQGVQALGLLPVTVAVSQ